MEEFKNISYMISHIFLMLFIYLFIPHRFPSRKTMAICFSSFLMLTLTDLLKLKLFPDSSLCYVLVTIFQIAVTQSTVLLIARHRDSRVLFLGLSASNYVIAGTLTATTLYIYTDSATFSLIGSLIVHLVILVILYLKIRDICLKCCEREPVKSWLELCLIPVFFYCGFSFLAFFPYTLDEHPEGIPGTTAFIITMFVSYVVVLRYIESELQSADIYWKNALFESQIKSLENQYRLAEQSAQSMRILRHDMRHYSDMIDALLTQKEYGRIRELIRHLNETADEHRIDAYCQNIIVNSILSDMIQKAHDLHVDVHLDALVPEKLPVNDYELAAVIANLMENALMCVKELPAKKRCVDVKLNCATDHLLVETVNEFEHEIIFDTLTGLPRSTQGKNHGFGMPSISAFTDKIGGELGCYCEDGRFRVLIAARF